jgi:mRNA interferase MazF
VVSRAAARPPIRRGEVWWADFGEPRGHQLDHRRPALVISADAYNASAVGTVTVIALTSTLRHAQAPGNVLLPRRTAGLKNESVVNVTQVHTIDRCDLIERSGKLPSALLRKVEEGLGRALDLPLAYGG